MYRCEFLVRRAEDCAAPAPLALSVRHRVSDVWNEWPVCVRHVGPLARELASFGFVVSRPYPAEDQVARDESEREADWREEAAG